MPIWLAYNCIWGIFLYSTFRLYFFYIFFANITHCIEP